MKTPVLVWTGHETSISQSTCPLLVKVISKPNSQSEWCIATCKASLWSWQDTLENKSISSSGAVEMLDALVHASWTMVSFFKLGCYWGRKSNKTCDARSFTCRCTVGKAYCMSWNRVIIQSVLTRGRRSYWTQSESRLCWNEPAGDRTSRYCSRGDAWNVYYVYIIFYNDTLKEEKQRTSKINVFVKSAWILCTLL